MAQTRFGLKIGTLLTMKGHKNCNKRKGCREFIQKDAFEYEIDVLDGNRLLEPFTYCRPLHAG